MRSKRKTPSVFEVDLAGQAVVFDETVSRFSSKLLSSNLHWTCARVKQVQIEKDGTGIKRYLKNKVLVTRNGQAYSDSLDLKRFQYSLIWVVAKGKTAKVAKEIGRALRTADLIRNPYRAIKA
jgi:hypothetical protein